MFFDSHTHLNLAAFDKDRKEIIEKTLEQGVFIINIGTCYKTSKKAMEIAQQYENCWATIGLHPSHVIATKIDKDELSMCNDKNITKAEVFNEEFESLLEKPKVVAIGECGLDYSYLKDFSENDQIKYKKIEEEEFRKQIQIAKKYNLPLSLHVRDLYEEALIILEDEGYKNEAVFHFFTGNVEQVQKILKRGFYLSFSGVITYSEKIDQVIKDTPLEKILIETDAPYVAPTPYRGDRNEPIYVKEVAKKIAQIKKLPLREIEEATFENTLRLFKIHQNYHF
ncbi:MAG TPA: TatD family hydrolase [Patescibacteria group bacterium]|nr:TatD family hydrolase [Patescibacteria group bacterium]